MPVSGQVVGKNGYIMVEDSTSASVNLSGDSNSISLSWTADTPENTAFGDTTRTRLAGLKDWTLDFSGFFNDTAASGVDTILSGILGGSTRMKFGPAGSSTGYRMYTGCCMCTDYSMDVPVDGMVTVTFSLIACAGSLTGSTF